MGLHAHAWVGVCTHLFDFNWDSCSKASSNAKCMCNTGTGDGYVIGIWQHSMHYQLHLSMHVFMLCSDVHMLAAVHVTAMSSISYALKMTFILDTACWCRCWLTRTAIQELNCMHHASSTCVLSSHGARVRIDARICCTQLCNQACSVVSMNLTLQQDIRGHICWHIRGEINLLQSSKHMLLPRPTFGISWENAERRTASAVIWSNGSCVIAKNHGTCMKGYNHRATIT